MTRGSTGEGNPSYLPKEADRSVWENMDKEDIINCFKCGKKIDKYWHKESKPTMPMSTCGNCFNKR